MEILIENVLVPEKYLARKIIGVKNPAKEVKVSYFKFLAAGKNFQANLIICLAIVQQNNHPDKVSSKVEIAFHLVNNAILIIGLPIIQNYSEC